MKQFFLMLTVFFGFALKAAEEDRMALFVPLDGGDGVLVEKSPPPSPEPRSSTPEPTDFQVLLGLAQAMGATTADPTTPAPALEKDQHGTTEAFMPPVKRVKRERGANDKVALLQKQRGADSNEDDPDDIRKSPKHYCIVCCVDLTQKASKLAKKLRENCAIIGAQFCSWRKK